MLEAARRNLHEAMSRARCDRAYRKQGNACIAIKLPSNAYLTNNSYGTGWACECGYRADDTQCVAVAVPANGYLVDAAYGPGWSATVPMSRRATCVAVQLSEYAHLDYTGRAWDCSTPYRRELERCVVPE